jgi:hypothetical protein
MYSSLQNQVVQFGHYVFAFIILFIIWPGFIFEKHSGTLLESIYSRYFKIVLLIIALGYLLVLIKLFELLSIFVILLLLSVWNYVVRKKATSIQYVIDRLLVSLYDTIDGVINPIKSYKERLVQSAAGLRVLRQDFLKLLPEIASILLVLSTVLYSAYLRLYDAFIHAAPAMSDAYVTLAWMKYIDSRILFHDGIYPQGFHIYLATLSKFAAIDPLYVLRYTGPLNGVLTALGLYFVLSHITRSRLAGAVAASVYGIFGSYLATEWERQASTNSQEFGFVFVIPTVYFYYRYMMYSKEEDFYTAAAGTAVVGLVHQMAFTFTGAGMCCVIAAGALSGFKDNFKKMCKTAVAGIVCVVISVIPYGIGRLMGIESNTAASEFLFGEAELSMPKLSDMTAMDKIAIACIVLVLLYMFFNIKSFKGMLAEKFVVMLGVGAFSLYFWGGYVTQKIVVAARSGEFWGLVAPCCIGMAWYIIERIIPAFSGKVLGTLLFSALALSAGVLLKPSPIIPYKMHHDSNVEQYVKISNVCRPKTWWLVSAQEEDYALVLGKGFLVSSRDFMDDYDPKKIALTKRGQGEPDSSVPEDVFIYYEKDIFKVDEGNSIYEIVAPDYERREKEKIEMKKWLSEYHKAHDDIELFYEDENLAVYHINIPKDEDGKFREIWGG